MTAEDDHPGLRPALFAGGLLALAVLLVPLGFLVRERWGPLAHLDTRVEDATHTDAVAHGWLRAVAEVVTWVGSPAVVEVAGALLVVLLLRQRRRRTALYLAVCIAGAYTLSTVGKIVVDRARPVWADPLSHARGASFPSGHATGSAAFCFAGAIVLLALNRRMRRRSFLLLVIVPPVLVAASRVVLGVHYLSDVVAGLLLGWGWVAACTAGFTAWRAEQGHAPEPLEAAR
jgi:undecaprenyl-diphosphatase